MTTNSLTAVAKVARAAQAEARRRHSRMVEFKAFCSGGTMVFTGLLLAALYCLLTHQIPV